MFLYAFDLLELDGQDVRPLPLVERRKKLKALLRKSKYILYNDHLEGDGAEIFSAACRMGLEGIVSKRGDRPYVWGRSSTWLKIKQPGGEARREGHVLGTWARWPR